MYPMLFILTLTQYETSHYVDQFDNALNGLMELLCFHYNNHAHGDDLSDVKQALHLCLLFLELSSELHRDYSRIFLKKSINENFFKFNFLFCLNFSFKRRQ
jgi:hypothetical protein